jgi:hypothetical protein
MTQALYTHMNKKKDEEKNLKKNQSDSIHALYKVLRTIDTSSLYIPFAFLW